MLIHIKGGVSGYEPENIARMFFPGATLTAKYVRGEDLVFAAAGRFRLAAGVRRGGQCLVRTAPLPQEGESVEFALCSLLYELLGQATGLRMPWGKLTGVRPVRIIHDKRAAGWSEQAIRELFVDRYDCTPERFSLALQIADLQRPIIAGRQSLDYSLYIGIPFCPSRCSYCSFVSRTIGRDQKLVQPYVDKLCEEVRELSLIHI